MKKEICCPRFRPGPWDGKVFTWKNKKFIKDKVFTIFYMPLTFGGAMKRFLEQVQASNAKMPGGICLSDHTSMWNMDLYLAVDRKIKNAKNVTISGKFLSKVYEGPYSHTGKWFKDFEAYAKKRKQKIKKRYVWYTTCPICAKKYGKNYVVIVAEVKK